MLFLRSSLLLLALALAPLVLASPGLRQRILPGGDDTSPQPGAVGGEGAAHINDNAVVAPLPANVPAVATPSVVPANDSGVATPANDPVVVAPPSVVNETSPPVVAQPPVEAPAPVTTDVPSPSDIANATAPGEDQSKCSVSGL
jgi:hypothetical protein